MRHPSITLGLITIAAIVVTACSATAAPSASTAALQSASAAPSASFAPPSGSPSSLPSAGASASIALPSFVLPSTDKALEALIPDEMCGQKVQKLSMSGSAFEQADPEFVQLLAALGKTPADVSMAAGGIQSGSKCSAGIFEVKGADPAQFKQDFLDAAAKNGDHYTEKSLGGKTVLADPTSKNVQYGYFKGDALIFVLADSDADAATVIAALP
ncbi:MAG TPA: hypothetical protein VN839_02150 [Patescibacteria group bacterium]|nr:hypothetical protein [Patescibacteria group bacterium]